MSNNFCVNVPSPEDKPSVPSITQEEAGTILNAVHKPADTMLLKLLCGCGARISEVLAMTAEALQRKGVD